MNDPLRPIDGVLRTLTITWTAFLFTPIGLAVMWLLADSAGDPESPLPPMLMLVAVLEGGMLFGLRMVLMGGLALTEPRDLREQDRADVQTLAEPVLKAAARYQTGSLISFSFATSVAIMAFVATFLSGSVVWLAAGAVLSTVLLLVVRPHRGGLLSLLTAAERQAVRQLQQ